MKEIVLQGQAEVLRAAVLEQGELMEVYEEEGHQARLVGNIYRGRVENVLPGMQAAFVDVGLDKNAFLYVGDALPPRFSDEEEKFIPAELGKIEDVLKPGQELLVQVIKEPIGNKGARITTNLTLPGRYAVLLPKVDYVGVSRKIVDPLERERLRDLALATHPAGMGVIVRTLAADIDGDEISADVRALVEQWAIVEKDIPKTSVPGLVHQDANLISRLVRDLVDQQVDRITVDQHEIAVYLRKSLAEIQHPAANHVHLDVREGLFERYGVDDEIKKALRARVWLRNGGYLVVNQTEALTAIDVNTGKYVGKHSLEDTVVHTNLEAAKEIARQLRLRNIGGIIIIDFIDMLKEEDQQVVLKTLAESCAADKTKCHVLGLTQLGLVEMTRKKAGQPLSTRYMKICPTCEGAGRI